jgi:hypothetical protein
MVSKGYAKISPKYEAKLVERGIEKKETIF